MTLPRWMYGNPEHIILGMERRTCKGCVHLRTAFDVPYCDKGRKLKRCKFYQEATPDDQA